MPTRFIGKTVSIQIDRPMGSRHPKHGFIYPLNYGYVPGEPAPDGDDLDAYVLGVYEPVTGFTGRCIAVIHRLDDADDKLVLVPDGAAYSDEQILALTEFQERFFKPVVWRGAGERIARGRTAEVFAWPGERVLKLFYAWCRPDWALYEAEVGRLVAKTDLPSPKLVDVIEYEGRQGLIYERMDGPTVLHVILSQPWRMPILARRFADLHSAIHRQSGAGLPPVREWLRNSIQKTADLPPDLKGKVLQLLERLPDGDVLCHMDFHPDQAMLTARGMVVIDWMNGHRGHPLADVARTCVMLRFGSPPDVGPLMLLLVSFFKGVIYRGYLNRYRQVNPGMDMALLHDWILVVAAARLIEQIPGEKEQLLAYIQKAFLSPHPNDRASV